MDLLQENLLYLYKHKHDLFEKVQNYLDNVSNEKRCKLVFNVDNSPNLSYTFEQGTELLYSVSKDSMAEWLKKYQHLQSGEFHVIMYGLGLSYHLASLMELNDRLNFYIIEPEIDIFVETLKVLNIEQLISHPQVKLFCIGNEEQDLHSFLEYANVYALENKVNILVPYYTDINIEQVKSYYQYEYELSKNHLADIGFENLFGILPYENSIKNIYHLCKSNSLKLLRNKFIGCTALIVGGGPSLKEDIELIKSHRDRLLIIAAGTSVQSLLYFGLEPHLIISMDPGEANGKAFENVDTSSIPLVYLPQIYSPILEIRSGMNFHAFFEFDCIIDYLFRDEPIEPKFKPTASVSGTATQIAKYLGATTILFTGQDLSYPNKEMYAPGARHFSEEYLLKQVRNTTLKVENVHGEFNDTNLSMKVTLEDFVDLLKNINGVTFINTSSLGAKIKGAKYMPFEKAIESTNGEAYTFTDIKRIANEDTVITEYNKVDIIPRINTFIEECDFLIAQCQHSIKDLKKVEEYSRRNPNKAMSMLAKLEKDFSQVTDHLLFKMIIPSWNRISVKKYDQRVIEIEKESLMIEKSKLLNQTVLPFIQTVIQSLNQIKEEFETLNDRLSHGVK